MIVPRHLWAIVALVAAMICLTMPAAACLSGSHERLSVKCTPEKAQHRIMSLILGESVKPRQIAVVAGIYEYPNLPPSQQLPPAAEDIRMMTQLFVDTLGFDEVIVLKNADFNAETIRYLFQVYLPGVLSKNEKSRVVFTFSGHGEDFEDSGYLFFHDTANISIDSFEDTERAIDMQVFKAQLRKTIGTAQHFLALINACKGGHFLNETYAFGESPLEEKGAHGITAGGADDTVFARPNVGTGKGSVFFELVNVAVSGQRIDLNGQRFENPIGEDGILTTTELYNFLTNTIKVIENHSIIPRSGRLRPPAPGRQGELFLLVDGEKARTAFAKKFPKRAERLFGSAAKPAAKPDPTLAFLNEGFAHPPAGTDENNPNLITIEKIISGDYKVVNDRPWRRKVAVQFTGFELFQPRAVVVNGRLSILFLAKERSFNPGPLFLREFFPDTGKVTTVDTLSYDGGGYFFASDRNLKIVGSKIHYFAGESDSGRAYDIGSGQAAIDFLFPGERDDGFSVALSPNGRYAATGQLGNWADSAYRSASALFRLTAEQGSGTEFTGISLYDLKTKKRNILFKQVYSGDWSIQRVIWSDDSGAVYFDNSGSVACIWKYDLAERRLQKIVPEHSAVKPVFLRYGGKDYILYSDGERVMIATE